MIEIDARAAQLARDEEECRRNLNMAAKDYNSALGKNLSRTVLKARYQLTNLDRHTCFETKLFWMQTLWNHMIP